MGDIMCETNVDVLKDILKVLLKRGPSQPSLKQRQGPTVEDKSAKKKQKQTGSLQAPARPGPGPLELLEPPIRM